jgi:hypothetical protein
MTPREITRATIAEIAARHGTTPEELISHRRPKRLLRARMELAQALASRGWNGPQIGAAMNRDYTVVYFYLGNTKKKPSPRSLATPAAPPPPEPKPAPKSRPRRPGGRVPYAGWDPRERGWS